MTLTHISPSSNFSYIIYKTVAASALYIGNGGLHYVTVMYCKNICMRYLQGEKRKER